MDFYSIIISILRRFLVLYLSMCVAVEIPNPPLPPPNFPHQPKPPKAKYFTECVHAPTQSPTYPETMKIVSTKDDHNSAWASDQTTFGRKILVKIGCKEGEVSESLGRR